MKYEEKINQFKETILQDPHSPEYHFNQGCALLESVRGRLKDEVVEGELLEIVNEAQKHLIECLKIDLHHKRAQILLGKIFFKKIQIREAMTCLGEALDLPYLGEEWRIAAETVYMGGVREKSVHLVEKVRSHFPDDPDILLSLSDYYWNSMEYEKAKPLLEHLLKIDSESYPHAQYHLDFIENELPKLTKEDMKNIREAKRKLREIFKKQYEETLKRIIQFSDKEFKGSGTGINGDSSGKDIPGKEGEELEVMMRGLIEEMEKIAGDNGADFDFRFEVK